jgi:hypothetical protein
VSPADLQSFTREALCDNKLAAMAVEAGEKLSLPTVVQLGAELQTIYILASLESRSFDSIEAHRLLWQQTADFLQDAASVWRAVPTDGEFLGTHLRLLAQLHELAADRVEFYSIHDVDRWDYRLRKLD